MKMKKITFKLLIILIIAGVTNSCQKMKASRSQTVASDFTLASNLFDDMLTIVNRLDDTEQEIDDIAKSGLVDTCFIRPNHSCLTICKEYIDIDNWEWKITLDFGQSACLTGDGAARRGKIIAHRKGRFRIAGSVTQITTENYFVNSHAIEGIRKITNIGRNNNNNLQFTIIEEGSISSQNGKTITWNSNRTNTWTQGSETWAFGTLNEDGSIDELFLNWPDGIYDDVWEINGSAQGISSNNMIFEALINVPLRVQWCPPHIEITAGELIIKPENLNDVTVNYGNGDCDNEGVITVNGNDHTFKFRN
jgi:hypothetical protein